MDFAACRAQILNEKKKTGLGLSNAIQTSWVLCKF